MAAAFNKFNCFPLDLTKKVHDFANDSVKVMLTNTAPVATNATKADLNEIASGNGYVAGGAVAALVSDAQTGGVQKLVLASPAAWTAAGGAIGPFRYAVLYNSTPAAKPLIAFFDYGAAVTLNDGESFQVLLDQTNGIFTIQ